MKRIQTVIFFFFFIVSLSVAKTDGNSADSSKLSQERMLCTTITQGQQVRFNRCRNNEVMTGIQGFDPLTVYCTTILANCRDRAVTLNPGDRAQQN